MSYTQSGLIQASDYNAFLGASPGTTANTINAVYAAGGGMYGYGQTALPTLAPGATVDNLQWNNLLDTTTKVAGHQGTSIAAIAPFTDDSTSNSLVGSSATQISNNLAAVYNNHYNCAAQGASITNVNTYTSSWTQQLVFVSTVTFGTPDQARYFFNAGGQIAINFNHPAGTNVNSLWNTLCNQCGTLVISAPRSGTARIAGTDYSGVTKVGGAGSPAILATNVGYYGLTTSYQNIFKQLASSTGGIKYFYLSSYLSVSIKSNGTRGTNGDNGNIISIAVKLDEVPDGGTANTITSAGTNVTTSVRPPSTSYLTNTWGVPTITSSVTTSTSPLYV